MQLSPSSEDYLEAIHQLLKEEPHVHSVQVAQRLKVSKPSVNKAMGVLKEAGLVEQEPYGDVYKRQRLFGGAHDRIPGWRLRPAHPVDLYRLCLAS